MEIVVSTDNPSCIGVIQIVVALNSNLRHNSFIEIKKGNKMIDREFLASLNFRVMDENDKMGFAGVQSPVPLIAENDYALIIIDGDRCEVYGDDAEFGPEFVCESISELPY